MAEQLASCAKSLREIEDETLADTERREGVDGCGTGGWFKLAIVVHGALVLYWNETVLQSDIF